MTQLQPYAESRLRGRQGQGQGQGTQDGPYRE